MGKEEIIAEALLLSKMEKMELINRVLASMKGKDPVFASLVRFREVYHRLKGVSYGNGMKFSKTDFRGMKLLLEKLRDSIAEESCSERLLGELEGLMLYVGGMRNRWYFENRFTPLNLAQDYEKIYGTIKIQNYGEQVKRASDYL